MQLKFSLTSHWRSTLATSAVSAGVLVLCVVVFGTSIGQIALPEILGISLSLFALVFYSLVLGGHRALLLLWILLVTFWVAVLHGEFAAAGWMFSRGIRTVPDRFVAWSILAVPLGVGSAVFLHNSSRRWAVPHLVFIGCAIWLVLLIASAYLARHAPDVGSNPRDSLISNGLSILLIPFAFLTASAFIWAVTRNTE